MTAGDGSDGVAGSSPAPSDGNDAIVPAGASTADASWAPTTTGAGIGIGIGAVTVTGLGWCERMGAAGELTVCCTRDAAVASGGLYSESGPVGAAIGAAGGNGGSSSASCCRSAGPALEAGIAGSVRSTGRQP